MRSANVLVLAPALLFSACAEPPATETGAVTVSDSAGIQIVTNDLTRLTRSCSVGSSPRLTIGDRVGDPTHELYRVFGATVLSDGRVALVDQGSQQLRYYSAAGDLLTASGREGQGPGEFQNAFLLWRLPGDTLWVGDYRPWEFEVFAPDGEWLRAVRPRPTYGNPPRGYGLLSDGRMVLASADITERSRDFQPQSLHLTLHGTDGELIDTVRVVPNGRYGQTSDDPRSVWLYPWFESFAEMAAYGDRLLLGHGSIAEVRSYRVGDGLGLERILRWTGLDLAVSDADVEAARSELEAQYGDMEPGMRRQLVEPLVHDDRPVADALPAFSNVASGRDGSIWIKLYNRPGTDSQARWIRFDSDGGFLCHLEIPDRIEVYEFGADYLLGTEEGALEVELVTLYDLTTGD